MTDKIVYLVLDHGVDGRREKQTIMFASYDENERDKWLNDNVNKNYYSTSKRIVEVEKETKLAANKLNAVDKLLLGLEQNPTKKRKNFGPK